MPLIRFREFELDEQTLELRKGGVPVRLQHQPARVLAMLLSQHGAMVTREQIRKAVWGDDTFVDFEQGLNFCIRQIRLALDDRAEQPLFIETLPRLGYRFLAPIERIGAQPVSVENRRIRIAMAPIEHLGGTEEEYFAAGLTDDMISALSRIDPARLRVTAVPRLASDAPLADQLACLQRELDLDYLLRGSVRRSASTMRITAQLHDLKDKSVLWSETYDRNTSDLLAVQEDVTGRVSRSLTLELLPGSASGSRKYAASSAAYDAYLRGRFFWHRMTTEAIRSSQAYFTEAITLDPKFAPAYAGLADCYAQMGSIRVGIMKPVDALEKARPLLERAMELDDSMAEAHCTLGLLKSWYDLDWAGAEREFQIALRLDPSHLTTLLWQSLYLCAVGRHSEAIESMRRAREAEPLSPVINMYVGAVLGFSGQYDLALRQLNQAVELDPHLYRPYMFLGKMYTQLERYEEALAAFNRALALNEDNLEALAYSGQTLAAMGNREGALGIIRQVKETAECRTDPALLLACIYAHLNDADETFACLQKSLEHRCVPLYIFRIDPCFRRYESDPRHADFLRSMGLAHLAKPQSAPL